jgi:4-amino-4-deoxy-L-arabinose transferase-like glycosyltransferase
VDNSTTAPAPSLGTRLWAWLWATGILVPLLYLAFLFYRAPHLDPRDWDYDEGINLMKALLVNRGYAMYTEIWSDQPPLLTVALAALFHGTGPSVAAARILVMLLSAVLLWCFYLAVHKSAPTLITLIAVVLLVISEFYIRLSGAVMVGLPSLALAMVSLALVVTGRPGWVRVLLSAVVMALALQTKLLAIIVMPSCAAAIFLPAEGIKPVLIWTRRLVWAVIWSVALGLAFLVTGALLGGLHFDLIFGTHFSTMTRTFQDFIEGSALFFPHFIEQHVAYLIVGACGIGYALYRRRTAAIVPVVWIATGVVAFQFHRPLWYHYTILLTVPLTWLCAYGIEGWWWAVCTAWRRRPKPGAIAGLVGLGAAMVAVLAILFFYPHAFGERQGWQMTTFRPNYIPPIPQRLIAEATDKSAWVFTDHPFYAFQAGLVVPPEIAVLSRKSLETGIITQDTLAKVVRKYKPRFVIVERFAGEYGPAIMDYVNENYTLEEEDEPAKYFRRNE